MQRFEESQTWLVVFDRSYGAPEWWKFLLHRDFKHVRMYQVLDDGYIAADSLRHVMCVRSISKNDTDVIATEARSTAILCATVHYSGIYKKAPIEIMTCITVAKRILGIHGRWIWTPRGLYRELLKSGAKVVKPWTIPHTACYIAESPQDIG